MSSNAMKIVVTEGRDLDIALEGHEGSISIRWDGNIPDITLQIDARCSGGLCPPLPPGIDCQFDRLSDD
jgi:hypothetical protein